MVRASRWILILLAFILGAMPVLAANSAEENAFSVAKAKFDLSKDMSEKDFADFVHKYPKSIHVPEAILDEAQAMLASGKINSAIDLLSANQTNRLAPQYLYWLGQARFDKKDYQGAVDTFEEMLRKYRDSREALDATVREAGAYARMERWPELVQLLEQTNGLFQQSVRQGAVSEIMASGFLLLGEAQLAQGNIAGVEKTLQALDKQTMNTQLRWQRDYLASRLQRAEGRLDDALRSSENLLLTEDRTNLALGSAFRAEVLERLGNLDKAVDAYTNNLAPQVPSDQQHRAVLKIAELDLKQNKLCEAVQSLSGYLEQFPTPPAAEEATLALGEVRLKQALSGSDTNLTCGDTNLLQEAMVEFDRLTNGPFAGKAYLDQGWCLWQQTNYAASQFAFSNAAVRLPFSEEQAEARFKWADAQFELKDYAAALMNYNAVAEKYGSLPEAEDRHFIERALYQAARAALNERNMVAAGSALKNILTWYPNGFAGPSALLLTGQGLTEQKDPAAARELFAEFEKLYPANPLLSEVRLAIARTYEEERKWDEAIAHYHSWMNDYRPGHSLMPVVKFSVAWDEYMAGRETNALIQFTNFIAHFPTNELAARAQYWTGDFYFRHGDYFTAEFNYQLVFQNTNWPSSDLICEARMMAGRSAMMRFDYRAAISYFTNLWSPDCPLDLQVQATIAYADATISRDSTNKTADLNEAIGVLKTIPQKEPGTWQAAQAWGRIGDCYFALGAKDPVQYTNAANAYLTVIDSPAAMPDARSEARFKLGTTMENQAALKTGDEQTELLKQALDQYVDTFFKGLNDSSRPSPLWTKKSGMAAAQLAESLQKWQVAYNLYKQLKELLPVQATICQKKMDKLLPHVKNP
ncbi:MAG TPA: tetratricopeptide repeat protein [Candidatus Angelobacter sp.]|nr:tetratricopeptide repeat protein [Candidatus Angelobacter sp.]